MPLVGKVDVFLQENVTTDVNTLRFKKIVLTRKVET